MATTTNFGWSTPDDSANVKDGAAAIRSLGTAIDTTVATMVPKTIVDAKGDIIAATAADTVDRLAVGANDTVLTADSSTATGLKWATPAAGGMTSIATGSLSSDIVTISSIPGTYIDLVLYIRGMSWTTAGSRAEIRVNGDSNANYFTTIQKNSSGTPILTQSTAQWSFHDTDIDAANTFHMYVKFFDYAVTSNPKFITGWIASASNSSATAAVLGNNPSITGAITSISIRSRNYSFDAGTYILYGVK